MTLLGIIGTVSSVVLLFLLPPHRLDREVGKRFAYAGIGGVGLSAAGAVLTLVPADVPTLYPIFQFFFLGTGVVHALLLLQFRLLGDDVADSPLIGTAVTLVLGFAAVLGFSIIAGLFLLSADRFCASCVAPLVIPFLAYQSYRHIRSVATAAPSMSNNQFSFNPEYPFPPEEAPFVKVVFELQLRTGGRQWKAAYFTECPQSWSVEAALHDVILRVVSPQESLDIANVLTSSARWRLSVRSFLGWPFPLSAGRKLSDPLVPKRRTIRAVQIREDS